jgi:hypothetical protein
MSISEKGNISKPRVGVLIDNTKPNTFVNFLAQALLEKSQKLDIIIIKVETAETSRKHKTSLLFKFIRKLENVAFSRNTGSAAFKRLIKTYPVLELHSVSDRYLELSEADLTAVQKLNLDIIIRCNKDIIRGNLLTKSCKQGIISTHHGDETRYRGGPPGFWEVVRKEYKSAFIIQILTEDLDNGHILLRGSVKTKLPYIRNQLNLFESSISRLLDIVENNENIVSYKKSPIYLGPIYRNPNTQDTIRYVWELLSWVLRTTYRKTLRLDWQWRVHFSTAASDRLEPFKTLDCPEGHFLADPSLFLDNGKRWVVFEDFDRKDGFGKISLRDLDSGETHSDVLQNISHHSFPRIFSSNGELYMTVEANTEMGLLIYQCDTFPQKWSPLPRQLERIEIIDPLTFVFDNRTLIHVNVIEGGNEVTSSEIYEIIGENGAIKMVPFTYPHCSSKFERNAGIISNQSGVFRVTQISKDGVYGKHIKIYRISVVDDTYTEQEVFTQDSYPSREIEALHTLNVENGIKVFDSAKLERV